MLSAARTVAPVSCRPLQPASTVLHHQRKRTGGIALCQAVAETITQCITSSDVIDVEFLGQEQDGRCVSSIWHALVGMLRSIVIEFRTDWHHRDMDALYFALSSLRCENEFSAWSQGFVVPPHAALR